MSPSTPISSSDAFASKLTSITSTATVTIAARNQMAAGLASRDMKRPPPSPKHKPAMTATTIRLAPGMKPSDVKAASRLAAAANTSSAQPSKAKSPVPDKRPMTPKPQSNIASPRSRTASPAPGMRPNKKTPSSTPTTITVESPPIRKTPSKTGSGSSKLPVTSLKIVTMEQTPSSPLATIPPASVAALSPISPATKRPPVEKSESMPSTTKFEAAPSEQLATVELPALAAIHEEEDVVSSVVDSAKMAEKDAATATPDMELNVVSTPSGATSEEKKVTRRLTMLTGWLFGKKSTTTPPVSEGTGSAKDSQDTASNISIMSVTEEAAQPGVIVEESATGDVATAGESQSAIVATGGENATEEVSIENAVSSTPMKVETMEVETVVSVQPTAVDILPQVVEESAIPEATAEDSETPAKVSEVGAQVEAEDVEMVDAGVAASAETTEIAAPSISAPLEMPIVEEIQIPEIAVQAKVPVVSEIKATEPLVTLADRMDVVMEEDEECDTPVDTVPPSDVSPMVLEDISFSVPVAPVETETLPIVLEEHEEDESTEIDDRVHILRPTNNRFDDIDQELSESVPVEHVSLREMVVDDLKNSAPVLAERISLDDLQKGQVALDQEVPVERFSLDHLLMERHIPVERVALDQLLLDTRTDSDSSRSGSYGDIDMMRRPSPSVTPETIYDAKPFKISDFKLIKTVGTGSFGRVHLALHTRTNTYVALKVLRKLDVIKLKQVEHTLDEKRILEALCNGCPFLVHLYGSFMDCEYLYLVLEYIQG
ncbi:camp-dependent protein kinase catalytic subunit, partial [Chytriomyces hyalinus]